MPKQSKYQSRAAPAKAKKDSGGLFSKDIAIGGISLMQRALFAQHLAVMLKAGLNIVEALKITTTSVKGKMRVIVEAILKSVQAGHRLSAAFARYPKVFSGLFVGATYAGESSGTLDKSLTNIADQLRREQELVSKIRGAMLYPAVILIAAFVLGMAMTFFILPKIIPLFEGLGQDLPITTKALIWFAHMVQTYGIRLFVGIVAVVSGALWLSRQAFSRPVTHWLLLHLPIAKRIVSHSNLARFGLTLGTLLKSGLQIDEALIISKDTLSNYYYRNALQKVHERVNKGTPVSDNLLRYPNLFPQMFAKMIMVGERSGRLEESLFYLAEYYQLEVDNDTKSLSTMIEPILLLTIGVVVGFLALSIVTPIYNITSTVKK